MKSEKFAIEIVVIRGMHHNSTNVESVSGAIPFRATFFTLHF
jgi:hypothetical protein